MARLRITSWNEGRSSSAGSTASASRYGFVRAPAPSRPRRSSWRRPGAGGRPACARPARRPGTRPARRRRRGGHADVCRRRRPPARRARRRAGCGRARARPKPAPPRSRRRAAPPPAPRRRRDREAGRGRGRPPTRSIASRAAASCRRHSAAVLLEPDRLQHDVARIEDHLRRSRGQAQLERVRRFRHADAFVVLAPVDLEADRGRELERRRLGRDRLLLRDPEGAQLAVVVPLPASLQLGMARPCDPAVEQLVDVAPGRLLDGAREIPRLHRAVRVFAGVVRDRAPERGVAQLVPQHVQDAPAFFVEVRVEQVDRLVVLSADDRTLVAPRLVQVAVGVDEQLEVGLVAALGVLAPDVLEVGREPFVQPGLGPLAAGEQVAPPLVGELVRHQAVDVVIERGALVEQHQVGQRRRGGVLHAAEDELGDRDLAVARVGVRHADALGEEVDHLGRAPEAAAGVVLAPGRDEVEDVDAVRGARSAISTNGPATSVTR